jgi:hypothetical protein
MSSQHSPAPCSVNLESDFLKALNVKLNAPISDQMLAVPVDSQDFLINEVSTLASMINAGLCVYLRLQLSQSLEE